MGKQYEVIEELSNFHKLKVLSIVILFLIVVIGAGFAFSAYYENAIAESPSWHNIKSLFEDDLANFTPVGLLLLSFLGGFFFIPLPIELFFFNGLLNGNPYWLSLFYVLVGFLPSQVFDYVIGDRFSPLAMYFFSRKKVYAAKRWVNRYGSYAIFIFNLLPLPSSVLTFALGIAKYNPVRLIVWMLLGTVFKFVAIVGIYHLFS